MMVVTILMTMMMMGVIMMIMMMVMMMVKMMVMMMLILMTMIMMMMMMIMTKMVTVVVKMMMIMMTTMTTMTTTTIMLVCLPDRCLDEFPQHVFVDEPGGFQACHLQRDSSDESQYEPHRTEDGVTFDVVALVEGMRRIGYMGVTTCYIVTIGLQGEVRHLVN